MTITAWGGCVTGSAKGAPVGEEIEPAAAKVPGQPLSGHTLSSTSVIERP